MGLECTFDPNPSPKKKRRTPSTSRNDLLRRLEQVESTLDATAQQLSAHIESHTTAAISLPHVPSPATSSTSYTISPALSSSYSPQEPHGHEAYGGFDTGKLYFGGSFIGKINSLNGIPCFSTIGRQWIHSMTGEHACFDKLYATNHLWEAQHQAVASHPDPLQSKSGSHQGLPTRAVVEHFVLAYCSSKFSLAFPIIDPCIFKNTIDSAYSPNSSPQTSTAAKACIFALLSLASICREEWDGLPPIDADSFAAKAHALQHDVQLQGGITALHTFFMLTLYSLLRGNLQQGAVLHALTCRILFALGGHSNPAPSSHGAGDLKDGTDRSKQHVRQLFWLAYSIDKEINLRTCQPPSITDDYCDLTLPQSQGYRSPAHPDLDSPSTVVSGEESPMWGPGDLRLAIIKSKICRLLYSEGAFSKPDAQILRDIRELDDELERWRMSFTWENRPNLGAPTDRVTHRVVEFSPHERLRRVMTNFEYRHLIAAIHRASGRCGAGIADDGGGLGAISSSTAISIQASRATLLYLRASCDGITREIFWMVVFYPMSAVMTLFCNILQDPGNEHAREDLSLIGTVPQLIRYIRVGDATPQDELYFQMLDEFFAELARLGACAIGRIEEAS